MERITLEQELGGRTFRQAVDKYEEDIIRLALRDAQEAGGGVSKASRLLGFKHHQSLISLLATRHNGLVAEFGITIKPRRKPVITRGSKHKSMNRGDWKKDGL